ncbi:MAG: hypothetical protein WDA08_09405 [Weeksellaceae bacterium]|jgi:Spy/CpxP family protein refolding chaperone
MKKILFITAAFTISVCASAQQVISKNSKAPVETSVKNNFEEWAKVLKLTSEQMQKIRGIEESYMKRKEDVRATATPEILSNLETEKKKEIYEVLRPDQIEADIRYQEMKEKENIEKASVKSLR